MARPKRTTLPPVTPEDIVQRPERLRRTANGWAWKCEDCGKFASSESKAGRYLCRDHGGTTPAQRDPVARVKAVEAGKKPPRPPGRPVEHGLYSKSPGVRVDQVVQDYQARGIDPDATEEDMLYLRAHLDVLKEHAPDVEAVVDQVRGLGAACEALLRVTLSDGDAWFDRGASFRGRPDMTVQDALLIIEELKAFDMRVQHLTKLIGELKLFTSGLEARHTNLIKLAKERADTRLKNKAAKELDVFTMMSKRLLVLLEEVLPRDIFLALRKRYALDFAEIPLSVLQAAGGTAPGRVLDAD
ncbi:hypothetical protein [Deinococcus sp. PEB2-67]